ncbi:hypothetical protein CsatB_021291 [Cannabis sativa]
MAKKKKIGGEDKIRRADVDKLATELENMMCDNVSMVDGRNPCIFRVPNVLSLNNPNAYIPHSFSIGPFHYKKPHLKATQKIKFRYLHELLSRLPADTNPKSKLRELTAAVSEFQYKARDCYEGSIGMSMDEFVKVLVLDGCFIIELFCKNINKKLIEKQDPIFGVNSMSTLNRDLFLLENQIPWFVLDCLFQKTRTTSGVKLSLIKLGTSYLGNLISREAGKYQEVEDHKWENKHILDLLRNSLILPSIIAKQERIMNCTIRNWQSIPSATSLEEAGIQFKKATSGTFSSILDIQFKDGVLEIPSLYIDDDTEPLFRNLICLEQCLPNCEELICSYVAFLDHLVNTAQDMETLARSDIFENLIDMHDATIIFNHIFNSVCVGHFYYLDLVKEVNTYCQRSWPRYRRVLMRDYFKHPWALISVLVGAILLILTFLQTLFTIAK